VIGRVQCAVVLEGVVESDMGTGRDEAVSSKTQVELWEWAFTVRVMAILVSAQPPKSAPIVASLVLLK